MEKTPGQHAVQQGVPLLDKVLDMPGVLENNDLRCPFSPSSQPAAPVSLPDPTPPTIRMLWYWGREDGGLRAAKQGVFGMEVVSSNSNNNRGKQQRKYKGLATETGEEWTGSC